MDAGVFDAAVDKFLASRGLAQVSLPFSHTLAEVLARMAALNPHAYWLLGGRSKIGCNHTVVCKGGLIVHDPSKVNSGIVGPCSDGMFWATFITFGDKPCLMSSVD
jgi:hypothetical protein